MHAFFKNFTKKPIVLIGVILVLVVVGTALFDRSSAIKDEEMFDSISASDTPPTRQKAIAVASREAMSLSGLSIPQDQYQHDRMIVRNTNLDLEVTNSDTAKAQVEQLVTRFSGLVKSMSAHIFQAESMQYRYALKIPSDQLQSFITQLQSLGTTLSISSSSTDITEAFEDTEGRLKNLYLRRNRLRAMLETETKKLNDILAIDRELNTVQNNIEQYERTQKRRRHDVDYSTVNLTLIPKITISSKQPAQWSLEKSWTRAVNNLISASKQLIDILLSIIVYGIFWIPILMIGWWLFGVKKQ